MSKQPIVTTLLALVVLSLLTACGPASALVPPASPEPTDVPEATPTPEPGDGSLPFQEGFEGGLGGWQKGSDVPEDPDRPGEPIAWDIEISPDEAAEGGSSARFTIDGKQDDGTIWLTRPLAVEPDEALRIHLSFDLWSASESFNTLAKVAAYAGLQPPSDENDFDTTQPANLVAGWRTYDYTFEIPGSGDGQVWVALGISAVWENGDDVLHRSGDGGGRACGAGSTVWRGDHHHGGAGQR